MRQWTMADDFHIPIQRVSCLDLHCSGIFIAVELPGIRRVERLDFRVWVRTCDAPAMPTT